MIDGGVHNCASVWKLLVRERLAPSGAVATLATPPAFGSDCGGNSFGTTGSDGAGVTCRGRVVQGWPACSSAHAFAKKVGVKVSKLEKVATPKGEYLGATITRKRRKTGRKLCTEIMPKEITALLAEKIYWRKRGEVLFGGCAGWWRCSTSKYSNTNCRNSGRQAGHRIIGDEVVRDFRNWRLRECYAGRKSIRRHRAEHVIQRTARMRLRAPREDEPPLVATVGIANVTEFPSVIPGNFDVEFLPLPEKVLVTVMRDHRNCLRLRTGMGDSCTFLRQYQHHSGDSDGLIQHGNERVLRARLEQHDTFLADPTRNRTCASAVELLKNVTFQKDLHLGRLHYDKTLRVSGWQR